jgi:hypothetical protein
MFIGHYAVGFAAKRFAPRTSLGTLLAAALLLDVVWPILVLAGVERVRIAPGDTLMTPLDFQYYPYSHSLLMALLWGAAFGLLYLALRRDRAAALVVGLLVLSHWLLDLLVHRPDLPLAFGDSPKLGWGLWNSMAMTLLLEYGLFAAGVVVYVRTTRPLDRLGRWGFWGLVAFLALGFASDIGGPPPPSVTALAWMALALWVLVLWAWWVDRHRVVVLPQSTAGAA